MQRRTFLKGLGAFAVAPMAFLKMKMPKKSEIVYKNPKQGEVVRYTHREYANRIIVKGNHPRSLWPGIKKYWDEQYKEHEKIVFRNLF